MTKFAFKIEIECSPHLVEVFQGLIAQFFDELYPLSIPYRDLYAPHYSKRIVTRFVIIQIEPSIKYEDEVHAITNALKTHLSNFGTVDDPIFDVSKLTVRYYDTTAIQRDLQDYKESIAEEHIIFDKLKTITQNSLNVELQQLESTVDQLCAVEVEKVNASSERKEELALFTNALLQGLPSHKERIRKHRQELTDNETSRQDMLNAIRMHIEGLTLLLREIPGES